MCCMTGDKYYSLMCWFYIILIVTSIFFLSPELITVFPAEF